jgi:polysaccharide export outer membrane protein
MSCAREGRRIAVNPPQIRPVDLLDSLWRSTKSFMEIGMNIYKALPILVLLWGGLIFAQEVNEGGEEITPVVYDYTIGIEDVLRVVVWNEPDLTVEVSVRPDGKITIPLVNDIQVAGYSPHEVRDLIAEQLSQFIREPGVTVIVAEINSFRVFILGEVNEQGMLNFRRPTRLLQALASAGGLTEFSRKAALLVREQHGEEERIQINLKPLLAGNPDSENLALLPNDTVIVF